MKGCDTMYINYDPKSKNNGEIERQIYRYYAAKYAEIINSDLPDEKKENQIKKIIKEIDKLNVYNAPDKANELGIEQDLPNNVDENVINALVSLFAKRAKLPTDSVYVSDVLQSKSEDLEPIDTTDFENELRQYFTEHYSDLLNTSDFNWFISDVTTVKSNVTGEKKNGELAIIAKKHGINPEKFEHFANHLVVQDGLVSNEDTFFRQGYKDKFAKEGYNVVYATPESINKRLFDLYSIILFKYVNYDEKKLRDCYIEYAKNNGIEIENEELIKDVECITEDKTVDMRTVMIKAIERNLAEAKKKRGIGTEKGTEKNKGIEK